MTFTVKDIVVKVIPSSIANEFVKKHHYSGKVVPNSQLHFGCFLNGTLHGVLSYGASINKKGTMNLVKGTGWNEFIELNRMAFDEYLPKNSESRCIGITLRMIRKQAPHIKWVISFADATQCGDGTIYRASNFVLTDIRENAAIRIDPVTNKKVHTITAYHNMNKDFKNWQAVNGYQLRYIYFIDPAYKQNLTVPIIPYSKINELGVGMYKGVKK